MSGAEFTSTGCSAQQSRAVALGFASQNASARRPRGFCSAFFELEDLLANLQAAREARNTPSDLSYQTQNTDLLPLFIYAALLTLLHNRRTIMEHGP